MSIVPQLNEPSDLDKIMIKNNEAIHSAEVEVAPEDSMNLLDSFEYVGNQLQILRERMDQSDRELYRTVGEFVDSTNQTIQNLAAEALDIGPNTFLNPTSIESSQEEHQQLQNRLPKLKEESNSLLRTAYSNEEIDRLRNLNYLIDSIESRIQELSNTSTKTIKKISVSELKSQFSSLKQAKIHHNITAKSWQDLTNKLNDHASLHGI